MFSRSRAHLLIISGCGLFMFNLNSCPSDPISENKISFLRYPPLDLLPAYIHCVYNSGDHSAEILIRSPVLCSLPRTRLLPFLVCNWVKMHGLISADLGIFH